MSAEAKFSKSDLARYTILPKISKIRMIIAYALVAQLDRVPGYEPGG